MDDFIYSKETLTDEKINSIYTIGRSEFIVSNSITNSYEYEDDRIKSITHNGFSYTFDYDSLGNNTEVKVGSQSLIINEYEPRTSILQKSTYGNGDYKEPVYDDEDRVVGEKYNGVEKFKYAYNAEGNLGYHEDLVNNESYKYIYDLSGRLGQVVESDGDSVKYDYDKENNISNVTENINSTTYSTAYTISFKYNLSGIRTKKTVGTVTTKYQLEGDKVTFESNGTDSIHYSYDSNKIITIFHCILYN